LLFPPCCKSIINAGVSIYGGPYQVQSVGRQPSQADLANYKYDETGNRLNETLSGQTISLGLINKPMVISEEGFTDIFFMALMGNA